MAEQLDKASSSAPSDAGALQTLLAGPDTWEV
jgi:hypothetical protein